MVLALKYFGLDGNICMLTVEEKKKRNLRGNVNKGADMGSD
jgi:hypothetical protein